MNLNVELKRFIFQNIDKNVNELALKFAERNDEEFKFAINQISIRQKLIQKLPTFYTNFDLILPQKISAEQASSELTAEYKSNICNYNISADLTGGMGIDSLFFANKSKLHIYIEKDKLLCDIFKHNSKSLNYSNIEIINSDAESFIGNSDKLFDLIYIDPHRRSDSGAKLYFLEHTLPNVLQLLPIIKNKTKKLLIKTSPLLDISKAIQELENVCQVHILSIDNECKELLFLIDYENNCKKIQYFTVNFTKKGTQKYNISNSENSINCKFDLQKPYLYEPNSSIMKSGFFNQICVDFNLNKLAQNSHLYTSCELINDFPGRIFKIITITKYNKADILKFCENKKANISLRNFPDTTDHFKKKIGLKDGGDTYIFGSKSQENELKVFICKKVSI